MDIKKISNLEISIVITCFNNSDVIVKNLPKVIDAFKYKKNQILEVILVDDASTDKSPQIVEEKFPQIKLIRHKINRGFSAATNTGVRTAKGNIVVLLNSDVYPAKDFMVSVIKKFRDPKVFGVSFSEEGYSWARGFLKNGFINHEPGKISTEPMETFWLSGGSSACRRDYYLALGGMDEKLYSPFYWEDIDLCYRAQKRGLINIWDPESKVVHHHETSVRKLPKKYVNNIRERNELLFHWKNLTSPNLLRKHIEGVFQRVIAHPGYLKIVFMALMKLKTVIHARFKEHKESIMSDEAILARFSEIVNK